MKTGIDGLLVPDTSIWLEYFLDGAHAGLFAARLDRTENIVVPSITIYETFKKILSAKNETVAMNAARTMISCEVAPLDDHLAVQAARISHQYKIPMADSVIYATAQMHEATLWTMDADLKGLPGVKYFGKK